jgi:acetolactate synthase-1/2/3 large subunit
MDFQIYPFENCYPMIPAGGAQHEMVLEDPPDLRTKGASKKAEADDEGVLPA